MQTFTVQHVTTYRYRAPVAFGEHRMMFRPREDIDVKLIDSKVEITPEPATLRVIHDAFGNHTAIARFSGRARELRFESTFCVQHAARPFTGVEIDEYARAFPFGYLDDEKPDIASFLARPEHDTADDARQWARRFLPSAGSVATLALLETITRVIQEEFEYRRREAKGIQSALETLKLGHGSCRDFAVLMIDVCRALGFAARFVSGYLAVPLDTPAESRSSAARGATHAWAQVYLPGAGWIDFDPTTGRIGKRELITIAVVRDPRHAIPLHGTYIGSPADVLGMEVVVTVRRGPKLEPSRPETPREVAPAT